MKLYVVEITVRTVVQAEDEIDAILVTEENWSEIASDSRPDVDVSREVLEQRHLPSGWDLGCLPYGGDGNTRMSEIIGQESK